MKIITFYFSGTGNTWWTAKQFEEVLTKKGHDVTTLSVESPELSEGPSVEDIVSSSDKIIIGYPVYGSDMPKPMRRFLEKLPERKKMISTAVFCTQGLASGDGALFYRKELGEKGYQVDQAFHIIQGNNFYIPQAPVLFTSPEKQVRLNGDTQRAVEKFSQAIHEGRTYLMGNNPFGFLLGRLQRTFAERIEQAIARLFIVEDSRCTKCNLCVKSCPMKNITLENGKVTIGNNCNLCMRCYQFCKSRAINITEKTLDEKKFPAYRGPVKGITPGDIRGIKHKTKG